jgi:hypothetical protein
MKLPSSPKAYMGPLTTNGGLRVHQLTLLVNLYIYFLADLTPYTGERDLWYILALSVCNRNLYVLYL